MTNILIIGESHIASYELTVRDFLSISKCLNYNLTYKIARDVKKNDIYLCDILVCVRGNDPLCCYLCNKAYSIGRKVVLALDDDLLESSNDRKCIWNNFQRVSLRKIIGYSEIMITTSEYLGNKYREKYHIKYVLSDTIVDPTAIIPPSEPKSTVKLVYASSHNSHFNALILPLLNRIYDLYGDMVSLTIIGAHVDTAGISLPVYHVKSMELEQYRNFMRKNRFDIGLSPLLDTEMTRSKYYNKYLEYSMMGICGIYSNNLPYTKVIKDGGNGYLADNNQESWLNKIVVAIKNITQTKEMVYNAQSSIAKRHTLEKVASSLAEDLPWLVTYKAASIKPKFFIPPYAIFLFAELTRRLILIFNKKRI